MKLVTWNSHGRFAARREHLSPFQADITVVPECEEPKWSPPSARIWSDAVAGRRSRTKGLGIFAAGDVKLEVEGEPSLEGGVFVPVRVLKDGREPLRLLAVWTRGESYPLSAINAVRRMKTFLTSGPAVVLGDFNSNAIWDAEYPAHANHSALVALLAELGLTSAWHRATGEPQGAETPTYFDKSKGLKPYHIDYVFVPDAWKPVVSIGLGRGKEFWLEHSDHLPVGVEFR